MSDSTSKRNVIRVVFKPTKDEKGLVQCILPVGTEVLRCDKGFRAYILDDTWPVMLPEEKLEDPNEWDPQE